MTAGTPTAAALALARPPAHGRTGFWLRLRAGLSFALWLLPGFIAGSSVAFYVLGQNVLSSQDSTTDQLVGGIPDAILYTLGGAIIGLIVWVFIGWLAGRYCTAAVANADEFHKLAGRISALDAVLTTLPALPATATQQRIAIEQATRDRDRAIAWLSWDGADQQWAFGDLYVAAWRYVHAAEEALVDVLPVPVITADARMSLLRLNGSPIGDRESLQRQVSKAIAALEPATTSHQPTEGTPTEGTPTEGTPVEGTPVEGVSADRSPAEPSRAAAPADAVDENGPRATLRAAKSAINDFRDGRSDQLVSLGRKVRIRHVALSLVVALLFELAILALDPRHHLVEAFAVYFLVGALAGIALEAQRSNRAGATSAQDYGLNRERLFLTFSMAGAAACGGVILFVMLLDTTVANLLTAEQAAFEPGIVAVTPVLLLVAAAFGLAPSRLFTAVTGLTEQILIQSDLTSTTPTGTSRSSGSGSGGADDEGEGT